MKLRIVTDDEKDITEEADIDSIIADIKLPENISIAQPISLSFSSSKKKMITFPSPISAIVEKRELRKRRKSKKNRSQSRDSSRDRKRRKAKHSKHRHHSSSPRSIKNKRSHSKKRRSKRKKRQSDSPLSSSETFHLKLEMATDIKILSFPEKFQSLLNNVKCCHLFYHQFSNSFILIIKKYTDITDDESQELFDGQSQLMLKLKINFTLSLVTSISVGIINFELLLPECQSFDIIGYDDNKSLIIVDTFYEPISPLNSNIINIGGCIHDDNNSKSDARAAAILKFKNKQQMKNMKDYRSSAFFSFASKKLNTKKQVITKRFVAIRLNDIVQTWHHVY